MGRKSESKENSLIRSDPIRIKYNEIRSNPNCSNQVRIRSEPDRVGSDRVRIRIGFAHLYFSTIQLYICFKMFMTYMMRYVILAQMKTN